jgi:hypothetical protein
LNIIILKIKINIGGLGQLGPGLAELFSSKYGKNNVIISDIVKPNSEVSKRGILQNFMVT